MQPYLNKSGKSGISQYEITEDSISVIFKNNHKIYTYSNSLTSEYHVNNMKNLAIDGKGLSTYIAKRRDILKFTN